MCLFVTTMIVRIKVGFMFKLHMFLGLNDEYLHLLFCELVKEKWQFDLSEICLFSSYNL